MVTALLRLITVVSLMVSSELCEQKPDESWVVVMVVMVGPSGGMISPSPGSRTKHSSQQPGLAPPTLALSVVVRHCTDCDLS